MKVKPITFANGNQEDRELNPKEVSLLRALLGGLQWPATQSASFARQRKSSMQRGFSSKGVDRPTS